ncbi:MAG TPA: efflux transporter outer membrane subunit [Steroidobacteraceae bacterium]|nr:efflux transporter outer membrane subunit [Steroidobacteraceae bacterium]
MKAARVIWLACVLGMGGCTLEPHYNRPTAPVPPGWTDAAQPESKEPAAERSVADIGWREFFPDPTMQRLIELALRNNRDLRAAALNVQAAQAQYRIQRAELFPTVAANGLEQVQKYPPGVLSTGAAGGSAGAAAAPSSSGGQTIRFFEVGVGFTSYELDLFGRIRSLKHAALERYFALDETRRSTQLSLIAEVIGAYLAVLADEAVLKFTHQTLEAQTSSYDLIKRSLDAGTTTAVALRQAATTVDTAKANLAQYTRQAAQDRNTLMLLIGVPVPGDVKFDVDLSSESFAAQLPPGIPSQVLIRRPDVLAAEHQLIAANANIGAARAAFFPSIALTGDYGTASSQLSGLFKAGSTAWSFSPQISVPIFTGGANRANLDLARLQKNIYIAQYEKAVQSAFKEVDDALAARQTLDDQLEAQRALLDDSSASYNLADMRFRSGVDSFLPVLDAQRVLYAAQQSVVSLQLLRLQNLVTLYKALGGGIRESSVAR